jgi:hypothetical protein
MSKVFIVDDDQKCLNTLKNSLHNNDGHGNPKAKKTKVRKNNLHYIEKPFDPGEPATALTDGSGHLPRVFPGRRTVIFPCSEPTNLPDRAK